MKDIQFAPVPPAVSVPPKFEPTAPPEWLQALDRFFAHLFEPLARLLGMNFKGIETALIVLAVIGALWIAWAVLWPMWRDRKPRAGAGAGEDDWAPRREAALSLLEEADRLAAEGRFGEAAHLLLRRSVGQIAEARPDWLAPSSTAREIGAAETLPPRARRAFTVIAREVERSLFALRGLAADDWQRARDAYADFALVDLKGAA